MDSTEHARPDEHPVPQLNPAELHEIAARAHDEGIVSASPTVDATEHAGRDEHPLPALSQVELRDVEASAYDVETDLALPHDGSVDPATTFVPYAGQVAPPQPEAAYDIDRDTGI